MPKNAFADAQTLYDTVATQHAKSKFVPFALYGRGWSQIKQQDFAAAVATFSQLIDSYPQHQLAQQALMGRATQFAAGWPGRRIGDGCQTGPGNDWPEFGQA